MIIREFAFAFARATGTDPTPEQIKAVKLDICAQFGGERFYVPSEPKARRQNTVERLSKEPGKTQRHIAREGGMSLRSVRYAMNGK